MHGEDYGLAVLIFGPAVIGLPLLGSAIYLLVPRAGKDRSTLATVFGVIFAIGALGIGACYGMVFLGA